MPVLRDRPYERSYFLVDIGDDRGASAFRSVDLPVANADVVVYRSGNDRDTEPEKRPGLVTYTNLVLTRDLRGSTELYDWWRQTRSGDENVSRAVTVSLLDEAHEPVWTWRFRDAFPVVYRYSPLDATSSDPVEEILELAFESMIVE